MIDNRGWDGMTLQDGSDIGREDAVGEVFCGVWGLRLLLTSFAAIVQWKCAGAYVAWMGASGYLCGCG